MEELKMLRGHPRTVERETKEERGLEQEGRLLLPAPSLFCVAR